MLKKLVWVVGVGTCLVSGSRADEDAAPARPWFPPAFATQPPDLSPPPVAPCGLPPDSRPCWRKILGWVTYRPLPTHAGLGIFGCNGGCDGSDGCSCRRPLPCCTPHLYLFFLYNCRNCFMPPLGVEPGQPPIIPAPGDPPPGVDEHDVVPSH